MSLFRIVTFALSILCTQAVITRTPNGDILGYSSNQTDIYLGIPYGQIPARWLPATLPKPWTDTFNATEYGPVCHQFGPYKQFQPIVESENCLSLNIWVPKGNNASLPVRVWLHGGGYTAGFSNDYDGENLAYISQSIIVTINYRLGIFGFFPLPDLNTNNLGWVDQQLALRWVQENIPSFGGDKTNVMLFGQSAGGGSVLTHLLIESSWPLYSSLILESSGPFILKECQEYETRNVKLLETTYPQCQSNLTCYQQINALKFYEDLTINWITLWPCVGQKSQLSDYPFALLRKGLFNKNANVLAGFNSHEGQSPTLTFHQFNPVVTFQDYRDLSNQYEMPPELVNRYDPTTTDKDYFNGFSWLLGDYWCHCPSYFLYNHLARQSSSSIYAYLFIHPTENWAFTPFHFNATHLTEIPYVFQNNFALAELTPAEKILSLKMIDYFTIFHLSIHPWSPYKNNQTILVLDVGDGGIKTQSGFNKEFVDKCSFILKYLDRDDCHGYLTEQQCSNITHCQWFGDHCDVKATSSAPNYRLSFAAFLFFFLFY